MAKGKAKQNKKAASKVSYHYKPDNMTLEQWQIALRRQALEKKEWRKTKYRHDIRKYSNLNSNKEHIIDKKHTFLNK